VNFRALLRILLVSLFVVAFTFAKPSSAQSAVPPGACLYALDPSASRAFQIAGAQTVYTACGVVSESSASDAFEMEGSETLYLRNHAQVSVVGGAQLNGQRVWDTISNAQSQPVRVTNPGDPLASLVVPSSGTVVSFHPAYFDMNAKPANNTLQPGVYCGGLTIGNTNGTTFTVSPGVYIMAGGGLVLNSQASVQGTGVTFYSTASSGWGCSSSYSFRPLTISGQVQANLSAPSSGPLAGILYFADRSACSTPGSCVDQINGGSTAILNGALYAASDEIEFTGSNVSGYTMLVADKIYINGNSDFEENGSPFDNISITVAPPAVTLYAGQTQQFAATVSNSGNPGVSWSITPAGSGTIDGSGLYTAPSSISAQQTVTVTATSQADSSKTASATVTLSLPVVVSMGPANATLYANQTQQFVASVSNATNQAVVWSIAPAGVGAISAAGIYTAPSSIATQQTVTILATSQANPAASASATVTLVPPIAVSLTPQTATLYANQHQGFSATVINTPNTAITWSVTPTGAGSIDASGTYTAPASISTQQNVTITAMSQADPTKAASATVTLMPPVGVSVDPSSVTLYGGGTQAFTATVMNSSNTAVDWAVNSAGVGAIDASGHYAAPSSISTQQTVTITATSQADTTKSASATITLMPPIGVSVAPSNVTLYGGGAQTFTANVVNTSNTVVTWSVDPVGAGTIDTAGNYKAPANISIQQAVTITATSQADATKSAAATITLMPPVAVSITPTSAALFASQTQQFSTTVANSTNSTVTWSMNPSGWGSIDSSGLYTAPSTIPYKQTVTVTATSQADTTKSASATVTLSPPPCTPNGYTYSRAIVIDHTKVPNTDQANFPFLFSTTDLTLATIANGGHVTSAAGNDILFSADPAGQSKLDFEIEKYDTVNGQLVAWIRIPTLSHSSDTVVYLLYGNSSASVSQQNPSGVWNANYMGVWHLPNGTTLSANDSTADGLNGTITNASATNGQVDGGASFSGSNASIVCGKNDTKLQFSSAQSFTDSAWFKMSSSGGYRNIFSNSRDASPWHGLWVNGTTVIFGSSNNLNGPGVTTNAWHYAVAVQTGGSGQKLYVDGVLVASDSTPVNANGTGTCEIGNNSVSEAFQGVIDEVRASSVARSADWIAAEYANQNSPSTFYTFGNESTIQVTPLQVGLYASQSQQFSATVMASGSCQSQIIWSMPSGSPGSLSLLGLYTAPAQVTAPLTIPVTATNALDNTVSGTANITLLPPATNATLTLAPTAQPPYVTGTSQSFQATLHNGSGAPLSGIPVSFSVTGANNQTGTGTTDSNGVTSFTYAGSSSGTDTVQASATAGGSAVNSNAVTATWLAPAQSISTTTITGQFFLSDGSGVFDIQPSATPVFTQTFPTINFNPPSGTVPGMPSSIGINTRPFTDVTTDIKGNYTGSIIAQGGNCQGSICQAGVGSMNSFQAVFRGAFTVASAGNVTFNFYSDDGFILGIGNGATRVSGAAVNMPSTTPFGQFPVMGAVDDPNAASGNQVVVNFPAAGSYPFELDYTECCGGQIVLTMTQGASSATGIPPTASLALSPNSVAAQPFGGQQTFTVLATDAAGNPVPNANVGLVVTGANDLQLAGTTDSTGHVTLTYQDAVTGTDSVQAVAMLEGMVTYSNQVSVPWTQSSGTTTGSGTGTGTGASLTVSISAANTIALPKNLALTGTASDNALPQGNTIAYAWAEVSGPGVATFANAQQASTTVSFSQAGSYQLQLTASDVNGSASAQITVQVDPQPGTTQGWIGNPANGTSVSGIVPITVASGKTLASGVLTVYPAANPSAVTILNSNTTGSGQIGSWDTTQVKNGTYWITLQATDSSGNTSYNLALVTVFGSYKPGRVTSTVTDLVVPANGLAIQIQRTYDSLNAGTSGDFGYGWNLGINVDLTVGSNGDVTFTLGGNRKTFHLSPQYMGWMFPYYALAYTPEPGLFGSLTTGSPGCPDFLDLLVPDGSLWACAGGGYFNPTSYVYTDPTGTSYAMTAQGKLQAIVDKNGNRLDITANGITSSTGLSVPFVRDAQGRITSITDPQGNVYQYGYDENGNLASVTYPNLPTPSTYTYDSNHLYLSGTDMRGNALPSTGYYSAGDTDPNGLPLNNRLKSVTDALNETTTYAYDLKTNTTTITYPPDASNNVGSATMVYSGLGDLLSSTDPLSQKTTNVYDAKRNLTSVTDPLGNVTSYTYDVNGNRTSTTYPATGTSTNTTSTTAFNQFGEPTQTKDELGNIRTFNYDVNFNPQSVTDSQGTLASFAFNPNGTMQLGAVGYDIGAQPSMASKFNYDANGNLGSRTDALGRITSYTYDSLGHKVSMIEPVPSGSTAAAATTTYQYDAFGNLTQTTAPLGRVTSSVYDANGNKTSDKDARGNLTTYKYDALNRLIETDYADGTKATKTYDFRGNVVTETDQGGHGTQHQYDLAGRQISVTQAYGTDSAQTTTYAYDAAGRKTSETDALGHTTTYTYDAAGNLTAISGVKGNLQYGYDNARNRVTVTDGNRNTTNYQYDARKRLIETDYPDGTKKINGYDGPGNLTSVTDQAGHVVQYNYDAANQLQTVVQVNSPNSPANTTVVGYDADGNPITLQDANLHTSTSSFDLLGELTGKTLPDATLTETRQYDQNGNLTSLTHFNGVTTTYTYDNLNRLQSRTTPGEVPVSFTYTATGKRQTMTDASGTTTYSYDSMDRLTTKATPEGTLSYTYDTAGNLASMASNHTNGVSATYGYDDLNRLTSVVDANLAGAGTTAYTYDTANNLGTVTYPNGIHTGFTYDQLNRVSTAVSQVAGYSYQRGPTGNLANVVELNGRTVNWTYDGINRLTSESITSDPSKNNGSVSYGLDPVGNRTSASSSLNGIPSGNWSFNTDDEVSSESYDSNGNVIASGTKSFAYDSQTHLVSMNGGAVQILYDGDGNRVAKSANGIVIRYLVDDLNPTGYPQVVEELSGAGVVERQCTYGVQRISQNQPINNTWTVSFYGYDGGGSVRQLTNAAGAVTDNYVYDAFGNSLQTGDQTPNTYLYRGELFDSDLGLNYLRARYYNPLTGRFMSRDPEDGVVTDPATLHKYTYAGGDPVNWADSTGRTRSATATRGRTEYTEILFDISIASVAALDALACTVNIQLSMDALRADGSTNVVPNLPTCSARKKLTCKSPEFNRYIPVNQLSYPFPNRFLAFLEAAASNGGKQPRGGSVETALYGPCGSETSSYVPGTHENLYIRGKHVGDIVYCKACDDSEGEPTLVNRWDYIPGHE
jgi:RHS repeat-associated protein